MRLPAIALFALLAACGQSGDLYLPDEPVPAADEAPATDNDAGKDADERKEPR